MGLAASQARFLGLTARKSNTEYEGQQVNQQRTALANESASLYSQLTNLSVPTPPDITNYYTTEYSFTYNGVEYTMSSLPVRTETGYDVELSYLNEQESYKFVGGKDNLSFNPEDLNSTKVTFADNTILAKQIEAMNPGTTVDTTQALDAYHNNGKWYYAYTPQNEGAEIQYYEKNINTQIINQPYTGVQVNFGKSGDIESILVPGLDINAPMTTAVGVATNSVADDNAYDLAMSTYQKDYSEYEKTMAQINAKTEVLQQQDKTLELRLNQLDTEQNAISTEMDAVQKVIEKNVESTFKTFA